MGNATQWAVCPNTPNLICSSFCEALSGLFQSRVKRIMRVEKTWALLSAKGQIYLSLWRDKNSSKEVVSKTMICILWLCPQHGDSQAASGGKRKLVRDGERSRETWNGNERGGEQVCGSLLSSEWSSLKHNHLIRFLSSSPLPWPP